MGPKGGVRNFSDHEFGEEMSLKPKAIPDDKWQGMWRVRWPDGRLSDMVNLTRAKDAIAAFMESVDRRRRGRQSQLEARGRVRAQNPIRDSYFKQAS
jgi:hypothetical protein